MRSFTQLWSDSTTRFNVNGLLVVAVPLAALICLSISMSVFQAEHGKGDAEAGESARVERTTQSFLPQLSIAHSSICGFLLSGRDELLQPYKNAREMVTKDLEHMERAFHNDPSRWNRLQRLRPLIEKQFEVLSQLRQYAAVPGLVRTDPPLDLLAQGDRLMQQLRSLTGEIQHYEDLRLKSASALALHAQDRAEMVMLLTVLLGFIGGILGACLLTNRVVTSERHRAQTAVQENQHKLEQMLEQTQKQANDLAASEEELRRHKQVLESVLDSLSDGVAFIAPGGELLLANPAAARVFARLPAIPVEQWVEFYGLRTAEATATPCLTDSFTIVRALRGEEVPEQTVFVSQGIEDGVWLRLSARPLLAQSGEVRGAVVVFTDVTAHHRHQEMLSRAKDEAENANQAKSEFLSRMSHELRTPLNAILGFAQLLEIARLKPPHRESVGQILRAGRHLLTLINEVLEISRIESGKLSLSPEPVQLAELVAEASAMMQTQAKDRRIHIDGGNLANSDLYILADRQRLKQVVLNLLSNAVKYNRDEGTVTLTCEPAADDRVRVMVTDTGCGIPADKMDRLFNPFERLGADRTGIEGTGIGLALSRRLVEVMGGVIGVESRPDIGSTFWFELPRAQGPLEALEHLSNKLSATMTNRDYPTVLCIEDNPSNLQLIERILSSRPEVRLLTAVNGADGLRLAQQHCPNLILLDVHLPDMDGKEVLSRLKADSQTSSIPVIVVSADATSRQEARLREAGASGYLTKPLDVPKFLITVDEVLQYARVH